MTAAVGSQAFYYMKARYYDPQVGRFISEDPIGFDGGDVNLMAYVLNNPINWTDATGLRIDWGNYVIINPQVRDNLVRLNQAIVKAGTPDANFVLRISGGDRFRDEFGVIRSATNNRIVWNSSQNSPHLLDRGARAVDLQVTGVNDKVFDTALANTDFPTTDTRRGYSDGHTHVNLPNQQKYYWNASTGGCKN